MRDYRAEIKRRAQVEEFYIYCESRSDKVAVFFGPDGNGYTPFIEEAGVFGREEANRLIAAYQQNQPDHLYKVSKNMLQQSAKLCVPTSAVLQAMKYGEDL